MTTRASLKRGGITRWLRKDGCVGFSSLSLLVLSNGLRRLRLFLLPLRLQPLPLTVGTPPQCAPPAATAGPGRRVRLPGTPGTRQGSRTTDGARARAMCGRSVRGVEMGGVDGVWG